jgi:hypothetical protein
MVNIGFVARHGRLLPVPEKATVCHHNERVFRHCSSPHLNGMSIWASITTLSYRIMSGGALLQSSVELTFISGRQIAAGAPDAYRLPKFVRILPT